MSPSVPGRFLQVSGLQSAGKWCGEADGGIEGLGGLIVAELPGVRRLDETVL